MISKYRPGLFGFAGPPRQIGDLATANQFHKPVDRLRIATAKIVNFPTGLGFASSSEGVGDVGHIYEIAALFAVPNDSQRDPFELLLEKYAEKRRHRRLWS